MKECKLTQHIVNVFKKSKGINEIDSLFTGLKNDLKPIAKHFKITEKHAFCLAYIYADSFENDGEIINLSMMARHLGVETIELASMKPCLQELEKIGMIEKSYFQRKSFEKLKKGFRITNPATESIEKGSAFVPASKDIDKNSLSVLIETAYELYSTENHCLSITGLHKFMELFRENPLLELLKSKHLKTEEIFLFLIATRKKHIDDNGLEILGFWEKFDDFTMDLMSFCQTFFNGEHILVKENLVEISGYITSASDLEIVLTDHALNLLEEYGLKSSSVLMTNKNKSLLLPENIPSKILFYNPEEESQIDRIADIIQPDKFAEMQTRMQEKGLPSGMAILLHGAPGTGKTESVYQWAKSSQRALIHVDIAASKSMWYGESEKKIKSIFTQYQNIAKHVPLCPILLFNEADALLSARKEGNGSSVGQTENAIQNILLEEIEKFKGILVATTNFAQNLDKAFDRRFLFKVALNKPIAQTSAKIWADKLHGFTQKDYLRLAHSFDFSGGQIDNIVRKCEMCQIVEGYFPNIEEVMRYCADERLNVKGHHRVGFSISE